MKKEKKKNAAEEIEKNAETTVEASEETAEKNEAEAVESTAEAVEAVENETESKEENKTEESEKAEKKPAKKKTLIIVIAAVLAALLIGGGLFAIFGLDLFGDVIAELGGENEDGPATTYTVSLETIGGMAMADIDVYVYADATKAEMKDYAKTDSEGKVSFNLPENSDYAIVLAGTPKGYLVEDTYAFDGTNANLVLTSALIADEDISTATLGVGDVMYDFTVAKIDGEEITLSDVLKEKKMVMLNFWYSTCGPCVSEFPIISDVYETYKEDIEIIALNNLIMDGTVETVQSFQNTQQLPFVVATCPSSWSATFGIQGYPTTVMIDRYGVICLVEVGAVTSKRPWVCAMDHFTSDEYVQKLCVNGMSDLVTQIKPSYTMDTSEAVAALINKGDITVTYRPETEDENAEYIWPFIAGEKLGQSCVYASNKGIDDSYAIMYADVTLKAGQAVGFDYLASSERLCDVLYVIVNDEDVFQISGVSETEEWKSCYPCVAEEDGTYEIALCFLKDSDGAEGDDTVYIDNMRVVDVSEIDVDTYLPYYAAKENDDGTYSYVDVVYNEADDYYHVGTADGPLLLVDMMGHTIFNEEETLQNLVMNGDADKDGVSLYNKVEEGGLGMVQYFSYASNSSLQGVCTVTKELAEMLKQVAEVAGFDESDENEWLKMCKYFKSFGPSGTNLQDPIKGLAPFCAHTTVLGKDVETNYFYYDRAIIPRGSFSEFIPDKSGVYRFTSKSDYQDGIDAWIFNADCEELLVYEHDERMYTDTINCSMVYYMEAGTPYYINMAFWDIYATGYIYYDVEYLGESINLFRLAAPGYFTYDTNATGDAMYDIITGGIKPVLGDDGYYHDSEDGSIIYADFEGLTPVFSQSIRQMIEMGGFDFSKSETDGEILSYLRQNDNDVDKTKEYLKTLWGEDYDMNAENYQLDDIFAGRYHGDGPDLTEEVRTYLDKIDTSDTEKQGCVPVDKRLAEILQLVMDKYTFEDVENAWIKVCYYYDYLGPAN